MAVGDAHVFPGFLTPVLTQLFFPEPPTIFLTCYCTGEKRKYAGKKSRLNRGSNSQPPGHESGTHFLPEHGSFLYSILKKSVHFLMLNISKISRRFFCKFGMVSPKYTIHRSIIKPIPCWAEIFALYGKTHSISQRLSLNMPRLNKNQRIQALTMLARGDNVSNVSRAFGCHRNTKVRLRQRFQQTGGVADRRRPGRPRVTDPQTDRFITLTHLRRRFQTATSSARQYGISKQTVLRRPRQARNLFGQGGPMWDKCLQHVMGCPFAVGTTAFPLGGGGDTAVGSGSIL